MQWSLQLNTLLCCLISILGRLLLDIVIVLDEGDIQLFGVFYGISFPECEPGWAYYEPTASCYISVSVLPSVPLDFLFFSSVGEPSLTVCSSISAIKRMVSYSVANLVLDWGTCCFENECHVDHYCFVIREYDSRLSEKDKSM